MIDIDVATLLEARGHSDTPPVTVTISLYNYQDFIVRCLESVKSQTMEALDLIVVDDCSKDGSLQTAKAWLDANASRFARCVLLRPRKNQGLGATRNTAFHHARTRYVFVLDADNLLYPRCIERLWAALEHCAASFAYCYLEKFGSVTALQNLKPWDPAKLQYGNTIDAMVLMRRDAWEKVGGYATQMPCLGWEDFDLWFRLAKISGWGVLVPEILARYRTHSQSMLANVTNPNAAELWKYLRAAHRELFSPV